MKDLQVHLEKIRSDAAECLVLSILGNDGKRELFVSMAEHLNGLALEVEKAMAERANVAYATDHVPAVAADHEHTAAADHKQAVRSRWALPWLSVIVLVAIAGASFWVNNRVEDTKLAIAALLSGEQEARKVETQHLDALAARLDGLERVLDSLKRAGVEIAGPSNKQSVGAEEKPTAAETKPSAPEEIHVRSEEKRTSTPAADENIDAKQSDSVPRGASNPIEAVDRVGSVPAAKQAELDSRKPAIGPSACTQFRSFDPASGTYMTFDGRRRQCR